MTDLSTTIAPKSDQLNADDLIAGPRTITITKVSANPSTAEQPIAINFEGDNGKPYYACKSMRRVLVQVWGRDGNTYPGRSLTLYRDPSVKFGGLEVGGIRISHMSDIDAPITMALTATRALRKPFTVQPMVARKGERKLSPIDLYGKELQVELLKPGTLWLWWENTEPRRSALNIPVERLEKMKAAVQTALSSKTSTQSDPDTLSGSDAGGGPSAEQPPAGSTSPPADGDPIKVAAARGRAAFHKGQSKRAMPAEYKAGGREAEAQAWTAAYEDEADKDVDEPGSTEE